ncbi:ion channel [Marinobacterium aestuarii]|uniref:ion channel n=1 Tax=Marinobacterium aestuarii TaxID=1821621 RepID=UPI003AAFA2FA
MQGISGWGRLKGNFDGSLLDCVYFSFTTFTSLGCGDIQPVGYLRFLLRFLTRNRVSCRAGTHHLDGIFSVRGNAVILENTLALRKGPENRCLREISGFACGELG